MLKPTGWDHWHTGAQLPLVSPKRIADAIELFKENENSRKSVAQFCKERFDELSWQPTADLFAEKIKAAYEYGVEIQKQLA